MIASDGNTIDLMTFDRRANEKGQTLVISCDGNAGFYEIGVLGTPLELGYSVIGWNHPGFGGSTGTPYPQNDANAADAVMQFAINELGFRYFLIFIGSHSNVAILQLNEYEIVPCCLQSSQELTSDCLLIPVFLPVFASCDHDLYCSADQNKTIL